MTTRFEAPVPAPSLVVDLARGERSVAALALRAAHAVVDRSATLGAGPPALRPGEPAPNR